MKKLIATMPQRRKRVEALVQGLDDYEIVDAVVGANLDLELLELLGIYDPTFRKDKGLREQGEPMRTLTAGEVGCMLSHYKMWLIAKKQGLKEVICLEDDVDFMENWEEKLDDLLVDVDWDMVHLHSMRGSWGPRKPMDGEYDPDFSYPDDKQRVLVKPGLYTGYKEGGGTLGYALNEKALDWFIDCPAVRDETGGCAERKTADYNMPANHYPWSGALPVRFPSDGITNWPSSPWAESGLNVYITIPWLIEEGQRNIPYEDHEKFGMASIANKDNPLWGDQFKWMEGRPPSTIGPRTPIGGEKKVKKNR